MAAPSAVFVYGSLMAEEVVQVLLRRQPERLPATLWGYKRYGIRQQVYPAIAPARPSDVVNGWVLSGLSRREMHLLDEYEDLDYERRTERPILNDGSSLEAEVYVWREDKRDLLHGEWSYQHFREQHLPPYLQMSQGFLVEYEALEAAGGGAESS